MSLERPSQENNSFDEDEDPAQSRRSFLKWGAAAFGATFGAQRLYSFIKERLQESGRDSAHDDETLKDMEVIPYESDEPITLAHIERLKEKWKQAYTGEMRYRESLEIAQKRIRPFDKKLREIFSDEGVPEFLRHLAIPESHGDVLKKSSAGAAGMYQITERTAEMYGLKVSEKQQNRDDRLDPIKSGRAAAQILKDIANGTDGDWNIALAGYNGGFIWEYLKENAPRKEAPTYEDFLKFMNGKIDRIRSEVKRGRITHTVEKGETVSEISERYGIPKNRLVKANHLSSDIIHTGQELIIPLFNASSQRRAFRSLTRGFRENIEYVPKVYAVAELLDRRTYFNP